MGLTFKTKKNVKMDAFIALYGCREAGNELVHVVLNAWMLIWAFFHRVIASSRLIGRMRRVALRTSHLNLSEATPIIQNTPSERAAFDDRSAKRFSGYFECTPSRGIS